MFDRRYVLLLVVILLVPITAQAQLQTYLFGRSGWSLNSPGSPDSPVRQMSSSAHSSGGGSVGLAVTDLLIVRGSLNFSRSSGESLEERLLEEATPENAEFRLSGGSYSLLSGAAELLVNYNAEQRVAPYFVFGAGYFNGVDPPGSVDAFLAPERSRADRQRATMGLTGGMGVRIATSSVSVFAESRALMGFVESRQIVLPFNAGVALHLGR